MKYFNTGFPSESHAMILAGHRASNMKENTFYSIHIHSLMCIRVDSILSIELNNQCELNIHITPELT